MREYKFRVYDQSNRIMYTPEMNKEIKNLWAIPKSQGGLLNYPDGVLMQYTGRKDKNGIEFFEEDIVKIKMCYHNIIGIDSDCIDKDGLGEALYKVIYLENLNQFCLELISWTKFKPRNKYMHLYTGEIIGNSYETPYLLEEK